MTAMAGNTGAAGMANNTGAAGMASNTGTAGMAEALGRHWLDQDWNKLLRVGSVVALVQIFIALSGMPIRMDERPIIDQILSLGYLGLLWMPLVMGYVVGNEVVLEGVATPVKNFRDVVAGAVVGVTGNAGLFFLILGITHFDLRDPLLNWSPQTLDILEFGSGIGLGLIAWLIIGMVTGAAGGALQVVWKRPRRTIITVIFSVVGVAVLEPMVTDLSQGFNVEFISDFLYASQRGLTIPGTVVVGIVTAAVSVLITFFRRRHQLRLSLAQAGSSSDGAAAGSTNHYSIAQRFTSNSPTQRRRRLIIGFLIGAVCLILPMFLGKLTNELLANVGLFVLLALGLNIVVGLAGILDLGYVAFFAVGAYSIAVVTSPSSPQFTFELTWLLAILITGCCALIAGVFIGAPVLRMRGDYLAVVTLGFGEILRLLLLSDWLSGWFGGAQGILKIPGVEIFGLATVRGFDPRSVLYLVLVACAITIYISWRLENSRLGRAWMAVREDETVAETMGVNTIKTKLLAFMIGGLLGSISGAIFSAKVGSVFPSSFMIQISIVILVVVIFGGMGNIVGVIAGAAVLIGVLGGPRQPGLLQEFAEYKILIYGALLVWMMLKRPEGLVPNVRRVRELHADDFNQDAWLQLESEQSASDVR